MGAKGRIELIIKGKNRMRISFVNKVRIGIKADHSLAFSLPEMTSFLGQRKAIIVRY